MLNGKAGGQDCWESIQNASVDYACLVRETERGRFYWGVTDIEVPETDSSAGARLEPLDQPPDHVNRLLFIPADRSGTLVFPVDDRRDWTERYWIDVDLFPISLLKEIDWLKVSIYKRAKSEDDNDQRDALRKSFEWLGWSKEYRVYESSEFRAAGEELNRARELVASAVSPGDVILAVNQSVDAFAEIENQAGENGLIIDLLAYSLDEASPPIRERRKVANRRAGASSAVIVVLGQQELAEGALSKEVPAASIDLVIWDVQFVPDESDLDIIAGIHGRMREGGEIYLLGVLPEFLDLPSLNNLREHINPAWEAELRSTSSAAGYKSAERLYVDQLQKAYVYKLSKE